MQEVNESNVNSLFCTENSTLHNTFLNLFSAYAVTTCITKDVVLTMSSVQHLKLYKTLGVDCDLQLKLNPHKLSAYNVVA